MKLKKANLLLFILLGIISVVSPIQARRVSPDEVNDLKKKIQALKGEIREYQGSVQALNTTHDRLAAELNVYENDFQRNFKDITVPLLNWPAVSVLTRVSSWVEQQHLVFVLEAARAKVIGEPLRLIADRELKLTEVRSMQGELTEKLNTLQSKESLLSLQLEELKLLQKGGGKKSKALKDADKSE